MKLCKHEQLPRSCEMCELEQENAALKAELAEYERTVAHMRDGARLQDSATAAVLERAEKAEAELAEQCRLLAMGSEREARLIARVAQLEQQLELNRAVLAGARNCILKYVPVSIQSDRDFTLGGIKMALDRGTE